MRACSLPGYRFAVIILALLSAVGFARADDGRENCDLSVGWEPWKPYQYRPSDDELTGLDVELVRAVTEQMGCMIHYQQMPWQRTLFEIEQGGLVNMAAGADKLPERVDYAYFSEPYRSETVYLFIRSDDAGEYDLERLADIPRRGFRLGITAGYHYGERFDELMEKPAFAAQVETVRADQQNLEKLLLGRIDGFLADPVATAALLRGTDHANRITSHPMTIKQEQIHVMFSRAAHSPGIVSRFNEALQELREQGRVQAIMDRYLDY